MKALICILLSTAVANGTLLSLFGAGGGGRGGGRGGGGREYQPVRNSRGLSSHVINVIHHHTVPAAGTLVGGHPGGVSGGAVISQGDVEIVRVIRGDGPRGGRGGRGPGLGSGPRGPRSYGGYGSHGGHGNHGSHVNVVKVIDEIGLAGGPGPGGPGGVQVVKLIEDNAFHGSGGPYVGGGLEHGTGNGPAFVLEQGGHDIAGHGANGVRVIKVIEEQGVHLGSGDFGGHGGLGPLPDHVPQVSHPDGPGNIQVVRVINEAPSGFGPGAGDLQHGGLPQGQDGIQVIKIIEENNGHGGPFHGRSIHGGGSGVAHIHDVPANSGSAHSDLAYGRTLPEPTNVQVVKVIQEEGHHRGLNHNGGPTGSLSHGQGHEEVRGSGLGEIHVGVHGGIQGGFHAGVHAGIQGGVHAGVHGGLVPPVAPVQVVKVINESPSGSHHYSGHQPVSDHHQEHYPDHNQAHYPEHHQHNSHSHQEIVDHHYDHHHQDSHHHGHYQDYTPHNYHHDHHHDHHDDHHHDHHYDDHDYSPNVQLTPDHNGSGLQHHVPAAEYGLPGR